MKLFSCSSIRFVPKVLIGIVASLITGMALNALAAVNPTEPGISNSEGSFTITYFNGTKILLYGLKDITLTSDAADSPVTSAQGEHVTPFCVAETAESLPYQISLASANNFELKTTSSLLGAPTIPYLVTVQSSNSGTLNSVGVWGAGEHASGVFVKNDNLLADSAIGSAPYICNSSATEGRSIKVGLTGDAKVPAGVYSDTVTVVVSPI
ncbi:hypothetical protein [Endozoicomonas ascidiicola]|uniref:hypothetical protein n=1 Tax=Endozoicomonas ascidiicola TaxID=1698521 RepID=UPI000832DEED|nr:hypothetical protein [Endozoicomonas ascidiicola]